jgi:hypothetical protein
MKRFSAALFALIVSFGVAAPAHAATAFLQSCEMGTSVTGRMVYVGTYSYGGQTFSRSFASYCPQTLEVY